MQSPTLVAYKDVCTNMRIVWSQTGFSVDKCVFLLPSGYSDRLMVLEKSTVMGSNPRADLSELQSHTHILDHVAGPMHGMYGTHYGQPCNAASNQEQHRLQPPAWLQIQTRNRNPIDWVHQRHAERNERCKAMWLWWTLPKLSTKSPTPGYSTNYTCME